MILPLRTHFLFYGGHTVTFISYVVPFIFFTNCTNQDNCVSIFPGILSMYRVTVVPSTASLSLVPKSLRKTTLSVSLSGGFTWLVSMGVFGFQNGQSMVLHI